VTGELDSHRESIEGELHLPARGKAAQVVLALCCFAFPLLLIPLALQESVMERWVHVGLSKKAVKTVVSRHNELTPLRYVLAAGGGLYRSTNGGVRWVDVNSGLPSDEWGRIRVQAIAADAANSSIVYAGVGNVGRGEADPNTGLYLSHDSGATWFGLEQDMAGKAVEAIATTRVPATAGSKVCVATAGEIHCSVDEGRSWKRLDWRGVDVRILSLAIHPDDPDVIYVGTEGGGLYGTENGGSSWVAMSQGLEDPDIRDIAISATASHKMYLATGGGVYRSTDAGATWQGLAGAARGRCVNTVAVHPRNADVLFVGLQHGAAYCSTDGGMDWAPLKRGLGELTVWSLALDSLDTTVLWAGTADGVWRYAFEAPAWSTLASITATPSPTPELTPTPTVSPQPIATVSPTDVPALTVTPVPSSTPSPTSTDTPEPTATHTVNPSPTATPTRTMIPTPQPPPPSPTSPPPSPTEGPTR